MVAISDGLFQGLQQHGADAAAKNSSLAGRIERAAVSVQGIEVALFRQVSLDLRHTHHRTSHQHHVALIKPEILARLVDRQQ